MCSFPEPPHIRGFSSDNSLWQAFGSRFSRVFGGANLVIHILIWDILACESLATLGYKIETLYARNRRVNTTVFVGSPVDDVFPGTSDPETHKAMYLAFLGALK